MAAYIEVGTDALQLSIPTPRFTDMRMSDWRIGQDLTVGGPLTVHKWSDRRIANYYIEVDRYERYGQHIKSVAQRFGRSVTGGIVGWACERFDVPLRKPGDRSIALMDFVLSYPPGSPAIGFGRLDVSEA